MTRKKDVSDGLQLKNQLCFPLYAAARKVTGAYQPVLKPLGITYTQYIVFLVLWETDGCPVNEICNRLFLDNGTVTPLLKKLESEGFIRRVRSVLDERSVQVFLTEKGKALKEKVSSVPFSMRQCMTLDEGEAKELYRLLYKILS